MGITRLNRGSIRRIRISASTLIVSSLRGGVALSLVAAVVIPVAAATSFDLASQLLSGELRVFAGGRVEATQGGVDCFEVDVIEVIVAKGEYRAEALILLPMDSKAMKILGIGGVSEGEAYVGGGLLREVSAGFGEEVTVCKGGKCTVYTVVGSLDRPWASSYIVASPPISGVEGSSVSFCPPSDPLYEAALYISRDASSIFNWLALIVFASYAPILYAALRVYIEGVRRELLVLATSGVSGFESRISVLAAATTITIISTVLGVVLAMVAFHLSQWALRFTGSPSLVKPLPSPQLIITVTIAIVFATAVLSLKASDLGRDSIWRRH